VPAGFVPKIREESGGGITVAILLLWQRVFAVSVQKIGALSAETEILVLTAVGPAT
jgi:hypothetical protein